jgi:DNA-binding NarL/FixJ family response regulator
MNLGPGSRGGGGSVAIAGVDASYSRRLLQSLRAGNGQRTISAVTGGSDVTKQIAASLPSVILFDLGPKPDMKALATVSALSSLAKTIVLAGTEDDGVAVQALKAGAAGFCSRDTSAELLRRAVQLVEAGEIWVGRRVMVRLIEELAARRGDAGLGRRGADAARARDGEARGRWRQQQGNRAPLRDLSQDGQDASDEHL